MHGGCHWFIERETAKQLHKKKRAKPGYSQPTQRHDGMTMSTRVPREHTAQAVKGYQSTALQNSSIPGAFKSTDGSVSEAPGLNPARVGGQLYAQSCAAAARSAPDDQNVFDGCACSERLVVAKNFALGDKAKLLRRDALLLFQKFFDEPQRDSRFPECQNRQSLNHLDACCGASLNGRL